MAVAFVRHMGRNSTATSWLSDAYLARTETVRSPVDMSVYDAAGQSVRQVAYPGDAVWPLGDGWTPGRYEVVATDANGHVLSAALIAQ